MFDLGSVIVEPVSKVTRSVSEGRLDAEIYDSLAYASGYLRVLKPRLVGGKETIQMSAPNGTRRDVLRLVIKLTLLAVPFLVLLLLEAFVLPVDVVSSRCWEAMSVRSLKWAFQGPFYPNYSLAREEVGDLGMGTKFALKRPVVWVTDAYGFRNRPSRDDDELDVIIVGDSMTAGSGLTQDDILPEVLEQRHGLRSYGYAPSNMNRLLSDPRFSKQLPKVVVLAAVEGSLGRLVKPLKQTSEIECWTRGFGLKYPAVTSGLDRLLAPHMTRFVRARLRPQPRPIVRSEGSTGMLFMSGEKSDDAVNSIVLQHYLAIIRELHQMVSQRGSHFVFLPIPDKEFVYAETLPSKRWPTLLPDLVRELRAAGISVIDTPQAFRQARIDHPDRLLYQLDDTHWNGRAIEIAAELFTAELMRVSALPELTSR